jgi:hypothetical protein
MFAKKIPIEWHPNISIYASEQFLKTVGDEYGWIGGFDNSGNLRCILPYTIIKKGIFRMARFRVETIQFGDNISIDEEKKFLNSVVDLLKSIRADMIIPATTNTIFRTYPDDAIAAPYGSYIISLTQQEENLWNNLHSKHRNVIRKAIKEGVEIRCGMENMKVAHELIQDTLKRSKMDFMGFEKFKSFIHALKENVKIFIAVYKDAVQGCAVIPYSNHSAYYLYGGSSSKPITGANNLLQWEAISQFSKLGVKNYDFVGVRIAPEKGSKQEGLAMFKQRFGAQLSRGYMWKYSIKPIKFAIYSMSVRFLRGGDIVDAEKHKLTTV